MGWLGTLIGTGGRRRSDVTTPHVAAWAVADVRDPGGHLGVLRDVTDHGAELLWPTRVSRGRELVLVVACAQGLMRIDVVVDDVRGTTDVGRFHAHSCHFRDDSAIAAMQQRHDELRRALAASTDTTPSRTRWSFPQRFRRAPRQRIALPVRVQTARGAIVTVTRDLSATGLSVLTGHGVAVGEHLVLDIAVPGQRWRGPVTIARCQRLQVGSGCTIFLWGLRFDALDTQHDIERFRQWITK